MIFSSFTDVASPPSLSHSLHTLFLNPNLQRKRTFIRTLFFCKKATSIDGVALAVDLPLDHAEKLTVDWNYQAVCVQFKTSQENETETMKR